MWSFYVDWITERIFLPFFWWTSVRNGHGKHKDTGGITPLRALNLTDLFIKKEQGYTMKSEDTV